MMRLDRMRLAAARHAGGEFAAVDQRTRAEIFDALFEPGTSPWQRALDDFSGDLPSRVGAVHTHLVEHPLGEGPSIAHNPLHRRDFGTVYTPPEQVDALVDEALSPLAPTPAEALALRVLDPACGTGSFLAGAYRWIVRRAAGVKGAATRALGCLHGVDRDAAAVALCARTLTRLARDEGADTSLAPPILAADALALEWSACFAEAFANGGFDAVLGNPPYVSYAGRQSRPLDPQLRARLARRFPAAARWPSAHGYFLELAAREIAPRVIAFVVPDQVAHLPRYGPLRASLARSHPVAAVRFLGEDVFPGVITPTLAFVARRDHRGPTRVSDRRDGSVVSRAFAADEPWTARGTHPLLARLREGAVSIAAHVVDRGLRTTEAQAQLVAIAHAGPGDLPVLEGACVRRYVCDPPRIALRHKAIGRIRVAPDAAWDEVAFVLRQTARYPIVGPRRHVRHFRNSLLGLRAVPGGLELRYLVGLLNSTLLRWAYGAIVQESAQRAFPQVKKAWLGALPVRAPSDARERCLAAAIVAKVDALLADPSRDDLDAALDDDVCALYGLDAAERAALTTCGSAPR